MSLYTQTRGLSIGVAIYDSKITTDQGLAMRKWVDDEHSINGNFILGKNSILVADYIWYSKLNEFTYSPFYYGTGVLAGTGDFKGIGINIVGGFNVILSKDQWTGFIELAPTYIISKEGSGIFWQVGLLYTIN